MSYEGIEHLPEFATLTLKPYCRAPKRCPKCGHGPVALPAWIIRWFNLCHTNFSIAYCRGGMQPVVEHEIQIPFVVGGSIKQECRPICAGVSEPHLHVHCSTCSHAYLMRTYDAR